MLDHQWIDSQGDMIGKLRNLAIVADFAERVVIIDPTDIAYPPALNLFDFGLTELRAMVIWSGKHSSMARLRCLSTYLERC